MKDVYKIVKIVSDHEVVINAGSTDGLRKDDQLEIFLVGEEVIDPDTKTSLGTLDTIKAYIVVKNVYPNMAVCENAESKGLISEAFGSGFGTITKRLNVDSTQISGGFSEFKKIRIGDLVRKTLG